MDLKSYNWIPEINTNDKIYEIRKKKTKKTKKKLKKIINII